MRNEVDKVDRAIKRRNIEREREEGRGRREREGKEILK